jgi:succinoglycan biosynthesis transport protein ExoP
MTPEQISEQQNLPEIADVLEVDLYKILQVLKRHWLIGTSVFTVVLVLVLIVVVRKEPTYKATGTVIVEKPENQSLLGLGINIGDLDSLQGAGPIVTQAELVRGVPLIQKTIDTLGLVDDEGELFSPQSFMKKLRVETIPRADVLKITYSTNDASQSAQVVNTLMQAYIDDNLANNRVKVENAREFIEEQLPRVEQTLNQAERALRQFKEDNQVISLSDETGAAVSQMNNLNQKLSDVNSRLAGISARSQTLRQQIDREPEAAAQLVYLSQSPGLQASVEQYQQLQSQLNDQLTRYRPDHPEVVLSQRQVDAAQSLMQEKVSAIVQDNSAIGFSDTDLQLGQFRTQLVTDFFASELERLSLVNQAESLIETRAVYQQRADTFPRLSTEQADLERRIKVSQTTYESLLTQYQEIRVAEQQTIANTRIISPALVPEDSTLLTSTLGKLILAVMGTGVAASLGVAAALVAHLLDRKMRTIADAKGLFGYPVLGVIPSSGEESLGQLTQSFVNSLGDSLNMSIKEAKVIVRDAPRSAGSAAFQMLQANLKFLSSDKQARVITITSSIPGEGKSTVSSNLAAVMAQIGRRVLLVDADMRRPTQHKVWDLLSPIPGLSDLLVGEAKLTDVLAQDVMPNLSIIPAGSTPPNPIALLDSERMSQLLNTFRQSYDYIIIDTPPLAGIADATVIGKMSDGVLLVSRLDVCTLDSAKTSKQFLKQGEQNVLGLVINDVNSLNEPDSYFYGGHYYYGQNKSLGENGQNSENFDQDDVSPSLSRNRRKI